MNNTQNMNGGAVRSTDWLGPFGGLTLVESVHLTVQYRYPRTKKRRIRKKWSKRPENFRHREDFLYDQARGVVYAHPIVARRLKAALGPNEKLCNSPEAARPPGEEGSEPR